VVFFAGEEGSKESKWRGHFKEEFVLNAFSRWSLVWGLYGYTSMKTKGVVSLRQYLWSERII
jgi:hypothetical protein